MKEVTTTGFLTTAAVCVTERSCRVWNRQQMLVHAWSIRKPLEFLSWTSFLTQGVWTTFTVAAGKKEDVLCWQFFVVMIFSDFPNLTEMRKLLWLILAQFVLLLFAPFQKYLRIFWYWLESDPLYTFMTVSPHGHLSTLCM